MLQVHRESGGFAPWNVYLVKSKAHFTGAQTIPLGPGNALSRFYIKSSISSEGGWSFFAFLTA